MRTTDRVMRTTDRVMRTTDRVMRKTDRVMYQPTELKFDLQSFSEHQIIILRGDA